MVNKYLDEDSATGYSVGVEDGLVIVAFSHCGEQVSLSFTPTEAQQLNALLNLYIQRVKQQPVDLLA